MSNKIYFALRECDLVGRAGLFVKNKEELSRAVMRFLNNNSLKRKYSQLVQARAKAFLWQKTAKQTLKVYKRALGVKA